MAKQSDSLEEEDPTGSSDVEDIVIRRTTRSKSKTTAPAAAQDELEVPGSASGSIGGTGSGKSKPETTTATSSRSKLATSSSKGTSKKAISKKKKQAFSSKKRVTRPRRAKQNLVLNPDLSSPVIYEESQVFDCCFIKVSGSVYDEWKNLKNKLRFPNDEKLVLHLLDLQKESKEAGSKRSDDSSKQKNTKESKDSGQQTLEVSKQDGQVQTMLQYYTDDEEDEEEEEKPIIRLTKRTSKQQLDLDLDEDLSDISNFDDSDESLDGLDKDRYPLEDRKMGHIKRYPEDWCFNCDQKHEDFNTECPLYKPVCSVTDSVMDFSAKDTENESASALDQSALPSHFDPTKSFAQLSLPSPFILQVTDASHGLGVILKSSLKAGTQLGPLQGESILERDIPDDFLMKDLWQIVKPGNKDRMFVSTVNPEKSNWLRYLRPADSRGLKNIGAVVKENSLYFVTLKDLSPGDELQYWVDDPELLWPRKRADKKNCGGCNLKFSHPLYYRMHCSVFHDPQCSLTIRKYHCKICGLAVLGKENIVRHASAKHDGKGAYQCQFCKKHFLRLNYLEMHRTYGCSSNPDRTRPLCDLCGKKFCQPQKLKIHMKRMHNEDGILEDFQCSVCQKVLASKQAAMRHRKEVHAEMILDDDQLSKSGSSTSEQVTSSSQVICMVNCKKCGKNFKNKSNLKIHMLTHSGVKPFSCHIEACKQGFTTKQCLQFHYKKTHGYSLETMPKIERQIPYTLTAYSGGIYNNPGSPDEARMPRKQHSPNKIPKLAKARENRNNKPGDVYDFKTDDDSNEDVKQVDTNNKKEPAQTSPTSSTIPPPPDNKASLVLVEAALNAAALDLKPSEPSAGGSGSQTNNEEGAKHAPDGSSVKDTPPVKKVPTGGSTCINEQEKQAQMDADIPPTTSSHNIDNIMTDASGVASMAGGGPVPTNLSTSGVSNLATGPTDPLPPPGVSLPASGSEPCSYQEFVNDPELLARAVAQEIMPSLPPPPVGALPSLNHFARFAGSRSSTYSSSSNPPVGANYSQVAPGQQHLPPNDFHDAPPPPYFPMGNRGDPHPNPLPSISSFSQSMLNDAHQQLLAATAATASSSATAANQAQLYRAPPPYPSIYPNDRYPPGSNPFPGGNPQGPSSNPGRNPAGPSGNPGFGPSGTNYTSPYGYF